ncbi:cytochrome P450 [Streptomyces sp. NPDC000410]|uniref:cytochrome P450 n=1 Tax=Streptomyces sp. NPDC000410 TaxID=3154254 RepID=UPI00333208BB
MRIGESGPTALLIAGHHEVSALLTDPRLSVDRHSAGSALRGSCPALFANESAGLTRSLSELDPPDHTRLRGMLGKVFSPLQVELLRPRFELIASELVSAFLPSGYADLVVDFAAPLSVRGALDFLGIPAAEQAELMSEGVATAPGSWEEACARFPALHDYLTGLVAAKRKGERSDPHTPDLIKDLISLRVNGQELTDTELSSSVWLLLRGSTYRGVAQAISGAVLALLRHPDRFEELRADRSLLEPAIDELLRFADLGPSVVVRFAREAFTIGDSSVRAGDPILLDLTAANRDPRVFEEPDSLLFDRHVNPHLSFGQGLHYCLGASLARMELEVALGALLDHCRGLRLAVEHADLPSRENWSGRRLLQLPVLFEKA